MKTTRNAILLTAVEPLDSDTARVLGLANWNWDDGYIVEINDELHVFYRDPDDGYRSWAYCESVPDNKPVHIKNRFEPQEAYMYKLSTADINGVVIKNAGGAVILSAITDRSDGYYPVGHLEYNPQNLPCNCRLSPNA